MTIEQLRNIHSARPFKPFLVRMADGNEYAVGHPEHLAYFGSGRTIAVAPGEDVVEVIDLLLVASIHLGNGKRRNGRRR